MTEDGVMETKVIREDDVGYEASISHKPSKHSGTAGVLQVIRRSQNM